MLKMMAQHTTNYFSKILLNQNVMYKIISLKIVNITYPYIQLLLILGIWWIINKDSTPKC